MALSKSKVIQQNAQSNDSVGIKRKRDVIDLENIQYSLKSKKTKLSALGNHQPEDTSRFYQTLHFKKPFSTHACANCKTSKTPLWRKGWYDISVRAYVDLCNACGLKFAKKQFCPYCKFIYNLNQDVHPQQDKWLSCTDCKRWVHSKCEKRHPQGIGLVTPRKDFAQCIPPVLVTPSMPWFPQSNVLPPISAMLQPPPKPNQISLPPIIAPPPAFYFTPQFVPTITPLVQPHQYTCPDCKSK